jgi:hypothetical protein
MAIYRLIAAGTFGPDEIKVMIAAYESALTELAISDREDRSRNLSQRRLSA